MQFNAIGFITESIRSLPIIADIIKLYLSSSQAFTVWSKCNKKGLKLLNLTSIVKKTLNYMGQVSWSLNIIDPNRE